MSCVLKLFLSDGRCVLSLTLPVFLALVSNKHRKVKVLQTLRRLVAHVFFICFSLSLSLFFFLFLASNKHRKVKVLHTLGGSDARVLFCDVFFLSFSFSLSLSLSLSLSFLFFLLSLASNMHG